MIKRVAGGVVLGSILILVFLYLFNPSGFSIVVHSTTQPQRVSEIWCRVWGGVWGIEAVGWRISNPQCYFPLSDAGKQCNDDNQCNGFCVPDNLPRHLESGVSISDSSGRCSISQLIQSCGHFRGGVYTYMGCPR